MDELSSDEEESQIRQELSKVPLGELQQLRQQMGTKKFNAAFNHELDKISSHHQNNTRTFKRANKHRPREMSSKKPVSRFREVVVVPRKEVKRDPRFDERCGHLNKDLFSKSFSFLEDVKERERLQIKKEAMKTKDPHRKQKLQKLVQNLENSETNKDKVSEQKLLDKEHKKSERQLVSKGHKPFYLSKALQRKVLLAKRYKELKESGRLEKFLVKKRKRNTARDRKRMAPKQISKY